MPVSVNPATGMASVNGARVELTPSQAIILHCLTRREVADHDMLIRHLWDQHEPEEPASALQVHVSDLRKRLKPHGVMIRARYGIGYALVDLATSDPASAPAGTGATTRT